MKGVIFDFDGTLYGDWRLWITIIEETLREFNLPVTGYEALELARKQIRASDQGQSLKISGIAVSLAREKGLDHDDEVRSRFFEKLEANMDKTGPPQEVTLLLEQLKKDGFVMGIVSFVRQARLARRLDKWNLTSYFRSTISPEQVSEFKPSPEPYFKAIADFHLSPRECLVVGDEPVDIIGGKRAGTRTAGLPQGFYSRNDLERAGADTIISSLNALPSVLK